MNREIPLKKLYCKYILRLASAYLIWSAIFSFTGQGTFTSRVYDFLDGPFHMWFVPMLIGLYICTPLIKKIITDDKSIIYFLILSFIFASLIPTVSLLIKDFSGGIINRLSAAIASCLDKLKIHMVLGYSGYYILGHYLNKTNLREKVQNIIYILGIFGFGLTIILTFAVSRKANRLVENYFDYLTLNVLFSSAAVFVWFKTRKYSSSKINALMAKLSKQTFQLPRTI